MIRLKSSHAVAALCALGIPSFAHAEAIEGPAEVIDGDSLRVAGTEVRLFGIDAPEYSQTCFSDGSPIACGAMAKDMLEGMISGARLTCLPNGIDTHGRTVAVCRTSGVDVGSALVEAGWAIAFRRYGEDYVGAEARARAARVGIWQWDFQSPEEFRVNKQADLKPSRQAQAADRPSTSAHRVDRDGQCLIKGNHSRRGEWIYHLPGMPYYDTTRAEAFFCTEAQARAAGYRRAIVR